MRRGGGMGGFTLFEMLLSMALMAMLSTLLATVFSNCRKTAQASVDVTDRIRKEVLLREMIQAELDVGSSLFSLENVKDISRGFSFLSYGDYFGRHVRVRVRYVFEPDPELPVYRLTRYAIANGIGEKETKETLLEGVGDPQVLAYSEAAEKFVSADELPEIPKLIRLKFKLFRTLPKTPQEVERMVFDEIQLVLSNGYSETPEL